MPRLPRRQLEDGVYHVTARGSGGMDLFDHDLDRLDFLGLLERAVRRFGWACSAYCLMTTHYHLVLESTRERLSRGMHWLNGSYSQRFNQRHRRRGHLFESRFSAWVVHDERHLEATLAYVLENPVRAGLCVRPEDWPWTGRPSPPRA